MFNSVNLSNFCPPQARKERAGGGGGDFGERSGNLYLPSCTYYVPEFPSVPSFGPGRQLSYPYPANLAQVPREVPYALEPSGKWRGNYAGCYAAEELMHRECLPPAAEVRSQDEEEALPLLQIPDPGAGARILLQRLHHQGEAAAALAPAQPQRPPGQDLVPESPHEGEKAQPGPPAVLLREPLAVKIPPKITPKKPQPSRGQWPPPSRTLSLSILIFFPIFPDFFPIFFRFFLIFFRFFSDFFPIFF
uniref:Homeobox C11 n=1 Tax=Serinus canaria TaxID=9135 RepID=A0A8C9MQJ3_SERCA